MEVKGKYGESKREQTESLMLKGARAPKANHTGLIAWSRASPGRATQASLCSQPPASHSTNRDGLWDNQE